MDSKLTYEVKDTEDKMKLREYLRKVLSFSGRLIKQAALSGRIAVNGKVVKLNYVLRAGDFIEFQVEKEESQNIEPENIPLDIAYEDMDLIIINKSPNMVVHPTRSYPSGTLANGLLYYFREKGENCIVRLVSRLDMDTSGLILVAKNQFAHMALARDMSREDFEKSYLAIVHGNLEPSNATIDLPIFKPEDDTIKRIVDDKGQKSITHYQVSKRLIDADLVELKLETGRTHQIRVHLSHLGHPIFGDSLYGTLNDEAYIGRQALHAFKLRFPHPRTGEIVTVETGLPRDMDNLLERLTL